MVGSIGNFFVPKGLNTHRRILCKKIVTARAKKAKKEGEKKVFLLKYLNIRLWV
jgi:hypothetical protein